MDERQELTCQLVRLLQDYSISLTYIIPGARGVGLTGLAKERLEEILARLEAVPNLRQDLVYANGCFFAGRYVKSAAVYSALLEGEPGDQVARFNLGLCYVRLKQPQDAVREFTQVIQQVMHVEPLLTQAHYQRGNVHDDLGEPELALIDYETSISLEPDFLRAHYNRGIVLAKMGRHRDAIAQFDQVLELRPDLSNAYLNRGAAQDEMGRHHRAIADYAEALILDPDNVNAWFNRARTHYYLGCMEESIADYSEVLRLRSDDAEALNNRGLAFDAVGDYHRALVDYEAAALIQPNFAEVFNNKGAALEALEDHQAAMDAYLAAAKAAPDFAVAYFNAARLCSKLGDLDQCLTHLETAEKLESGWMKEAAEDDQLSWVLDMQQLKGKKSDNS